MNRVRYKNAGSAGPGHATLEVERDEDTLIISVLKPGPHALASGLTLNADQVRALKDQLEHFLANSTSEKMVEVVS